MEAEQFTIINGMATCDIWTLFALEMERIMFLYFENIPFTVIIKWNAERIRGMFMLQNVLIEKPGGQILLLNWRRKRETIEHLNELLIDQLHN
jgi:uncharacterized protein YjiS (DUF1127 family)